MAYYSSRPEAAAVAGCKDDVVDGAHNPSSIEWVDERYWTVREAHRENSWPVYEVRMKVRGTNAFGGIVTNDQQCTVSVHDGFAIVTRMQRD